MLRVGKSHGLRSNSARSDCLCSTLLNSSHILAAAKHRLKQPSPPIGLATYSAAVVEHSRRGTTDRARLRVITAATKTKPDPVVTKNGKAEDESEVPSDVTVSPVSLTVVESCISALFMMVIAGWLGSLAGIDPWSYYVFDMSALMLAVSWGVPAVLALVIAASVPTGVLPKPSLEQCADMSKAEDDVLLNNVVQVQVDLGTLFFPAAAEVGMGPAQPPEPQPATTNPFGTGLRLFQLYVTRPWSPQFSVADLSLLTVSTGMQMAANELLARGLVVAVFAAWIKEAVVQADSSSVLFWGKVFRLNSPEAFRWVAIWVVALLASLVVGREAGRTQQWSRVLLAQWRMEAKMPPTATVDPTVSSESIRASVEASASHASTSAATAAAAVATAAAAQVWADWAASSSTRGDPFEGIKFVDDKRAPVDTYYNRMQAALGGISNAPPTTEDQVVFALILLTYIPQVLVGAWLYGSTGTLFAPLAARLISEVAVNCMNQANAQGGEVESISPFEAWFDSEDDSDDSDEEEKDKEREKGKSKATEKTQ